jgi:hypothetical protein
MNDITYPNFKEWGENIVLDRQSSYPLPERIAISLEQAYNQGRDREVVLDEWSYDEPAELYNGVF